MPVVARGDRFVYAQAIGDVVGFLGLDDDTGPALSPAELIRRFEHLLDVSIALAEAMPDGALSNLLPNRPRSWRVLVHHVFQIPQAYLDMEETGAELTYENLVAGPPDGMQSSASIAEFGRAVRARFLAWAAGASPESFGQCVPTYFGNVSRHEMLERTVWHSVQHARQVASLLESIGVTPKRGITAADLAGLPLTEKVWDDG